jgi:hypothetical protein
MRYVYSLIRYVPDPFRDEAVNVGTIVGSEHTGEWDIVQVSNLQRARAIQEEPRSILAVSDFIEHYGALLDPWAPGSEVDDVKSDFVPSETWLSDVHSLHNRAVQLSAPLPLSAESFEEALSAVMDRFLVDPIRRRSPYRKRTFARLVARELFVEAGLELDKTLFEQVVIETEHARESADFAVVNGRALQLTQAWSFQLPRQDELTERIKAWGWSLSRLREHGGHIRLDGRVVDVPKTVDLSVVFVPPRVGEESPALDAAQGVFSDLDVHPASIDEADRVAEHAVQLLEAASRGMKHST